MPLLHGSQGCTSFGLTLFVRHFKEAVPLQTTAMSEVATVLGGYENVEQAILNIHKQDQAGDHRHLLDRGDRNQGRRRRGLHQADSREASAAGEIPDGLCLDARLQGCVPGRLGKDRRADGRGAGRDAGDPARPRSRAGQRAAGLPPDARRSRRAARRSSRISGCEPSFLPDLAGSLDGHIPDEFTPTTIGGIGVDEVATMGQAAWTIAIGAQMRRAAEAMETKAGRPVPAVRAAVRPRRPTTNSSRF